MFGLKRISTALGNIRETYIYLMRNYVKDEEYSGNNSLVCTASSGAVVSALNIESVIARGCEREGTCGLDSDPGEPLEAQKEQQIEQ